MCHSHEEGSPFFKTFSVKGGGARCVNILGKTPEEVAAQKAARRKEAEQPQKISAPVEPADTSA